MLASLTTARLTTLTLARLALTTTNGHTAHQGRQLILRGNLGRDTHLAEHTDKVVNLRITGRSSLLLDVLSCTRAADNLPTGRHRRSYGGFYNIAHSGRHCIYSRIFPSDGWTGAEASSSILLSDAPPPIWLARFRRSFSSFCALIFASRSSAKNISLFASFSL